MRDSERKGQRESEVAKNIAMLTGLKIDQPSNKLNLFFFRGVFLDPLTPCTKLTCILPVLEISFCAVCGQAPQLCIGGEGVRKHHTKKTN